MARRSRFRCLWFSSLNIEEGAFTCACLLGENVYGLNTQNDWIGLQPDAMPVAAANCRARSYTLLVSQEFILREEWDVGAG